MLNAWMIGFVMGFGGSVPLVGPTAILVVSYGLQRRFRAGAVLALGSVVPESAYACLSLLGFSELLARHAWMEWVSRLLAVLILLAVGLALVLRKAPIEKAPVMAGYGRNLALGASLTGLNPSLIVNWGAAVTIVYSLGLLEPSAAIALPFGLGVGMGIFTWYAIVLRILRRHQGRLRLETRDRLMRLMGGFLLLVGLALLLQSLSGLGAG